MTDVHCHLTGGDPAVREFLVGRDFFGIHPWEGMRDEDRGLRDAALARLRDELFADPSLGVGEIGLDRLKVREIPQSMRDLFVAQLKLAAEFHRPVVLHGAKCWGQVVKTIQTLIPPPPSPIPSFLFHGFSRSDGLIPDIVKLNGFISVGSAVLNDHAVNYRKLILKIPADRLLLETDRTPESTAECPMIVDIARKTAELRGVSLAELESQTDANADRFYMISKRTNERRREWEIG